ncbi:prephenate dehydratase [Paramarasmius palmivorus]|uniref:prephenate dehydratase n=1 Tax=Paramarasmius palmivorus TaxID=297713 RepID=A0AAW0CHC8_9AGAR
MALGPVNGTPVNDQPYKVAFLGPLGTYSHQVAYERFNETVEFREKSSISAVFDSLGEVDFGIIPQENTIFGPVVETYDALRHVRDGFVCGDVSLKVQHCLVVREGVKLSDIVCVMSHEQALGQCRGFISEHLPQAATRKTPSTAAAAKALLELPADHAAICSKMCIKMFEGLEVLHEGIQDEQTNFTRFYLLAKNSKVRLPASTTSSPAKALLRIGPYSQKTNRNGQTNPCHHIDIATLITSIRLHVERIDRRPALDGVPFNDVYFVEVKRISEGGLDGVSDENGWAKQVEDAQKRIREVGGEAHLLGLW